MSEPKSSIHFEYHKKVAVGYFYHNSREKKTANSIFSMEHNYCNLNATEATKKFFNELNKKIEKYTKKTGKKLHKNAIKHISFIFNIKSTTTQAEIEELIKFLEDTLGAKIVQYAVHTDEGYVEPITGKKKRNRHVHGEMVGLDEQGNSVRRKLNKKMLIYIQDKVAEILQMQRGINYTKEKKKRPKRLNTYEYKEAMRVKEKEVTTLKKQLIEKDEQINELNLTKKSLEEEIKSLRKKMIEINKKLEENQKIFTQEDYKYLSFLKKSTNSKNLKEVYYKFVDFSQKVNKKIKELEQKNKKLEEELEFFNSKINVENVSINANFKDFYYQKNAPVDYFKKVLDSYLDKLKNVKDIENVEIKTEDNYVKSVLLNTKTGQVEDFGSQLKIKSINLAKDVKIALDVAEIKGWNLKNLKIEGSEEFVELVKKEINKRLQIKQNTHQEQINYNYKINKRLK